jgi:methylated-DNA-[protein]-cysteine S-methyltransferase
MAARGEAWLQEAFTAPANSPDLTRRIMDQIALQLDRPNPADLLARLDLAASPAGITRISYRRAPGGAASVPDTGRIGKLLRQAREELAEYFTGSRTFFGVPVDLSRVPPFERAALEAASRIPYGEVRTYKWIAEQLGKPDAARAVGGAMAGNPVPLIVPCHRVVKTDGGLGGYSFGLVHKEALLSLERTTTPYVGCASTKIFCRKGCPHERRIQEGGRIHFASGLDARTSGYRACTVCHPA